MHWLPDNSIPQVLFLSRISQEGICYYNPEDWLAHVEEGPLTFFLFYGFYYLYTRFYCHKHRGKSQVRHFPLHWFPSMTLVKILFLVQWPFVCLLLLLSAEYEFNHSWLIVKSKLNSFSLSSGWKKCCGCLCHSPQYTTGHYLSV